MKKTLIVGMTLLLVACSDPVLETATSDALHKSIERMGTQLNAQQAAQLKEDLTLLQSPGMDIHQYAGMDARQISEAAQKERKRRESLSDFTVLSASLKRRNNPYSHFRQIRIEVSVQNNTDYLIGEAFFEATLVSPGRELPWMSEAFSQRIRPALEPGDTAIWLITPPVMRRWDIDFPDDAVMQVVTYRLDDPLGNTLYSIEDQLDGAEQ